jgi:hypothetical protein
MAAFYVALSDAWVLKTWDALMIPKPFSRALVRFSAKIQVPSASSDGGANDAGANDTASGKTGEQMAEFQPQLQASLDRVTAFAEENVALVGSAKFPLMKN